MQVQRIMAATPISKVANVQNNKLDTKAQEARVSNPFDEKINQELLKLQEIISWALKWLTSQVSHAALLISK